MQPLTYTQVQQRFADNGLTLLVKESDYTSCKSYGDIRCSNGHTWHARLDDVLSPKKLSRESKGCSECAQNKKVMESLKIHQSNLLVGHTILDGYSKETLHKDNRTTRTYSIQCPVGHVYEKRNAELGDGCKYCFWKYEAQLYYFSHFNGLNRFK